MTLHSQQLILGVLWAAPVIQTVATLATVAAARSFRRNLGAQRSNMPALVAFAAVVLLLHAGYFLAPWWWSSGRQLLGAATMLPVALLMLAALAVVATQADLVEQVTRARLAQRVTVIACLGALFLAYAGPLVLMLAASA